MDLLNVDRNDGNPLYLQIKQAMEKMILGLPAHSKLPSEQELVNRFGVSRGTIREALRVLKQEGRIYQTHGQGTFVAPLRIRESSQKLASLSEEIEQQGLRPSTDFIRVDSTTPPEEIQRKLHVGKQEGVWKIIRRRLADGEPIAYLEAYLPKRFFPDIADYDLSKSLYELMGKVYNLRPSYADDEYRVVDAIEPVATALNLRPGDSVLRADRVAYCIHSPYPVEVSTVFIRPDRYVLHIIVGKGHS